MSICRLPSPQAGQLSRWATLARLWNAYLPRLPFPRQIVSVNATMCVFEQVYNGRVIEYFFYDAALNFPTPRDTGEPHPRVALLHAAIVGPEGAQIAPSAAACVFQASLAANGSLATRSACFGRQLSSIHSLQTGWKNCRRKKE